MFIAKPTCAIVLAINSLNAAVNTSCIIPMPITSALGLISINKPLTYISATAANGMLHKPSQVINQFKMRLNIISILVARVGIEPTTFRE